MTQLGCFSKSEFGALLCGKWKTNSLHFPNQNHVKLLEMIICLD
jgi:hypothetical protein